MRNPEFVFPEAADWLKFLAVAGEEGWKIPVTEVNLFQGPFADSVLALRCEGRFAGLVTFINHGASAWIGNLIVRADLRGRGLGNLLFEEALDRLARKNAGSVWLTASEAGFPLYQRRGFKTVGRVERWVLPGGGAEPAGSRAMEAGEGSVGDLLQADARIWGGHRSLLDHLLPAGRLFSCGRSLALLQWEPGLRILGPWYAADASADEQRGLLSRVRVAVGADEETVVDVVAGSVRSDVLNEAGFVRSGVTRLMALGERSPIRLEGLVSLASLGSIG